MATTRQVDPHLEAAGTSLRDLCDNTPLMLYAGEVFCLTAAMLWALAVVIFRPAIARHGSPTINLFKTSMATILLGLTVTVIGGWSQLAPATSWDIFFVTISGVVGITLGDTALFAAVKRTTVHRTLLLQTTAPIFTAIFATAIGDQLTLRQMAGGATVLIGIALVVGTQAERNSPDPIRRQTVNVVGLFFAVLAAFGQGTGVVLAKVGLDSVTVMPGTFLRLAGGTIGLLLLACFRGGFASFAETLRTRSSLARIIPASFFGTYLTMMLFMGGVALAPAAVAAVLLATTPIFSLIIEAIQERRLPSIPATIGTLVAVAGVAILTSH